MALFGDTDSVGSTNVSLIRFNMQLMCFVHFNDSSAYIYLLS